MVKSIIREIEQYLPIPYEEFKKLSFEKQSIIIDFVKNEDGIRSIDFYEDADKQLIGKESSKMINN